MTNFLKEHRGAVIAGAISTVIGGLILAVILSRPLSNLAIKGWGAIQIKVAIPFYWFFIMFLSGVFLTLLIVWKVNKKTDWFYDCDEFGGFIWEWPPLKLSELTLFCPECFTELEIRGEYQKKFICTCGLDKTIEIPYCILKETARKEFERRDRIGDHINAEKRLKPMRKIAKKRANKIESILKRNQQICSKATIL